MPIQAPQLFLTTTAAQTCFILDDSFSYGFSTYHYHKETQITLIVSGHGLLHIENTKYPFKAGDLFVIGANQAHMFDAQSTSSEPPFFIHLLFDHAGLLNALNQIPEFLHISKFLLNAAQSLQITGLQKEFIFQRMTQLKGANRFAALLNLFQLIDYISKQPSGLVILSDKSVSFLDTEMNGSRIHKIHQYTKQNFSNEILLCKVAAIVNMSVSNFCKYFKKQTNRTYYSYLTEIRIKEACKLILNKDYRISEIAYHTGFQNVISFNRTFKKFIGTSPTQYRQQFVACADAIC